MSGWNEVSLSALGIVERGRSRHRPRDDSRLFGGDMPFFQTGDVKSARLHMTAASQFYSEFGVSQSRVWDPGVTCITIAANIAETAVLGRRGCFPDSVLGFTPVQQPADAYFVKYLLDVNRRQLSLAARGTTQGNLSLEKLLLYRFRVPDAETRSRISRVLRSIDELIESNQRRIALLDRMAQAIYHEWIVHLRYPGHEDVALVGSPFGPIPKGWSVVQLGAVALVNRSSRRPSASEELRYLDISCLGDRYVGSPVRMDGASAPGRARRVVAPGDVVWSMVRPNRRAHALLVDPGGDWIASTGLAVITPTGISPSLLFETVSARSFSDYLVSRESGAAYPAVKPVDFGAAALVAPAPEIDREFERVVGPHHRMIWKLQEQSAELEAIRDLLLPMLVTGQIDVSQLSEGELVGAVG